MTDEKVVQLAEKYCPAHNEIDEESKEGHFHCEECADTIMARFKAAIREAYDVGRRDGLEEAANLVEYWPKSDAMPMIKSEVADEIRKLASISSSANSVEEGEA